MSWKYWGLEKNLTEMNRSKMYERRRLKIVRIKAEKKNNLVRRKLIQLAVSEDWRAVLIKCCGR